MRKLILVFWSISTNEGMLFRMAKLKKWKINKMLRHQKLETTKNIIHHEKMDLTAWELIIWNSSQLILYSSLGKFVF